MPRRFQLIPAVDVLDDEAVRLEQGSFDRIAVRGGDPTALAAGFAAQGSRLIHLVDLDGARTGRVRPQLVSEVAEAARPAAIQASGGIRSLDDAKQLLEAGAARVVVGTAAFATTDALERFAQTLGDRLVVALDVRQGRIAVAGWRQETAFSIEEAAAQCETAGVARILCTAIERDGTLAGPDLDLLRQVCALSGLPVQAAGGISSPSDLEAVARVGCAAAIVGRALLEGTISL